MTSYKTTNNATFWRGPEHKPCIDRARKEKNSDSRRRQEEGKPWKNSASRRLVSRVRYACSDTGAKIVACIKANSALTRIHNLDIDEQALAEGLKGNTRVKSLELKQTVGHLVPFARALCENLGLEALDFGYGSIDDAGWDALCKYLAHNPPSLKTLDVCNSLPSLPFPEEPELLRRARLLADSLRSNTVLEKIQIAWLGSDLDRELFKELIQPRLDKNSYPSLVRAVAKIQDETLRRKVFGRALYKVREDASDLWMCLHGNMDLVCQWVEPATLPGRKRKPSDA